MKAELDADGTLAIIAETPTESFALGHWWHLWQKREACLRVETPKEVAVVEPTVPFELKRRV